MTTWAQDVPAALATAGSIPKAICVYESPLDFADTTTGSVTIRLLDGSTVLAEKEIELRRPPVVLVHGIWSSPKEAWENSGAAEFIQSQVGSSDGGFPVVLADYKNSNAEEFERNHKFVLGAVQRAVETARSNGFACSQADVVGHSMGALLTRLMVQRSGPQVENYFKGNVHKLISIGTSHRGSFLADHLITLRRTDVGRYTAAALILRLRHRPIDGHVPRIVENAVGGMAPGEQARR